MIMLRVGMLTSGGDCQALNAAMRGVAKSLFNQCSEVEIYGFTDGYKGLIYGEYRLLKNDDFIRTILKRNTDIFKRHS